MNPHKKIAYGTGLIAFLFYACLGGFFLIPQIKQSWDLSKSFKTATAQVISVDPGNHCGCTYAFMDEQKVLRYSAHGCCERKIGSYLEVYYSPEDPFRSRNRPPLTDFYEDLVLFLVALFGFPFLAAIVAYSRSKRREG